MRQLKLQWGMIFAFFGAAYFIYNLFGSQDPWVGGISAGAFAVGAGWIATEISRWTNGIGVLVSAVGIEYLGEDYSIEKLSERLKIQRDKNKS